jgi:hypothetical protein
MQPEGQQQPETSWQYQPEAPVAPTTSVPTKATQPITWSASEYVAHQKGSEWFILLGLATVAGSIVIFFLTGDAANILFVVAMAVIFGVMAARKPRTLTYEIDEDGMKIGLRLYGYDLFKAFGVVDEDAARSIVLLPLQRFMPPISVYYDPKDEEKILQTLSVYLPYEEHEHDIVERIMRRIRF